ncbi:pilus assembly protein [Xaviernesmea oryzae]|uniref:Pilus assembly protein n=1 Tax=Xaviernesmea oryzae TaxID=464029 RepID=A0A1Q9B2Q1_9HYPH|nr:pilus assembly protein [Xaviernesmea oryzae]
MALGLVSLLAGCANRDATTTGSLPDDYRTRHPIVIAEAEHALDVPLSAGDHRLTVGARDVIKGFANDYLASSSGPVLMMVAQGGPNGFALSSIKRDVRATLASAGVPAGKIVETRYQAQATGDAAPIRLSYNAVTAKTGPCGRWPKDLVLDTAENRNYENFGCASQSNLAAQVANPMDLLAPRAMSPIDTARREQAISDYRGIKSGTGTTITFTTGN